MQLAQTARTNEDSLELPIATVDRIVFTIPEAAALLGVDRATVYRWIRSGHIPVVRMGASRMFVPKRPFLEQFGISELVAVRS